MECLEGRPLLSTAISAVGWVSGVVTHSAVFAIGKFDEVERSIDGGGFVNLGFYARQVSAGLDAFNHPEVFAISSDNSVWVNKGSGWISLGGYAKEISATVENAVYAIGLDDQLYLDNGSGWVNLGGSSLGGIRQVSAGADAIGNPKVYVIAADNAVYDNWGIGGFTKLFPYAKQISATMDNTVYAIAADNSVFRGNGTSSGGWVPLGGYVKEISAGIDGGFGPFVFGIGLNDGLWSNHGFGWVSFGSTYVTDVSGTSIAQFGVSPPADLAYVVAQGHGVMQHHGITFSPIGGYGQTPSGSATNAVNTWAPAARDISAVSWIGPFFLKHHAVYAIAPDDTVEVSFGGSPFSNLGGYAKQISAGLDSTGSPEVYAIGSDNAVWVNKGSGWVSLGGYAKEISATVNNTVYAIGTNDGLFVNKGSGWVPLATPVPIKQISAGTDAAGKALVDFIGYNDAVYTVPGTSGATLIFPYAKQISATMNNYVYAVGGNNAVYKINGGTIIFEGGNVKQISASIDATGTPEVFAIGTDDALWVNHGFVFTKLGPNYVTEISAPAVGVGFTGDLTYGVGIFHVGFLHAGSFKSISGGSVE
jgi:hypothetical protein